MNALKKIIGILCLLVGLGALGYIGVEVFTLVKLQNASEAERLSHIWAQDLQKLIEQKKMHPAWGRIREVALIGGTPRARDWIKKISSPVQVTKNGDHKLEILMLNWVDEGNEGAIIQYNLIDLKSGNMIWELGRTYVLKEAPKKLQEPIAENATKSKSPANPPETQSSK